MFLQTAAFLYKIFYEEIHVRKYAMHKHAHTQYTHTDKNTQKHTQSGQKQKNMRTENVLKLLSVHLNSPHLCRVRPVALMHHTVLLVLHINALSLLS